MQSSRSFEPEFIPEDLHEGDRTEALKIVQPGLKRLLFLSESAL